MNLLTLTFFERKNTQTKTRARLKKYLQNKQTYKQTKTSDCDNSNCKQKLEEKRKEIENKAVEVGSFTSKRDRGRKFNNSNNILKIKRKS